MSNFIDKLRLKERAEEDIYFAKRDRELIAALHRTSPSSPARDSRPGTRIDSNRPVHRSGISAAVRRLIRKLCPQCRRIASA
jgi:hypothetical protein